MEPSYETGRTTVLESARRSGFHKLFPILSFFATSCIFLALDGNDMKAEWSLVASAFISLAFATPLFWYATKHGPMLVPDRKRQSRNIRLGSIVFGVCYFGVILGLRSLGTTSLPPVLLAGLAGLLIGMMVGIMAVWLPHHRRNAWPPDRRT